jgi:glycosyltransferase involved in cell wall biosynthesis
MHLPRVLQVPGAEGVRWPEGPARALLVSEHALRGGAERSTLLMAQTLMARGVPCRLGFTQPGPLTWEAAALGVPLVAGAGHHMPGRRRARIPFLVAAACSGRYGLVHASSLGVRATLVARAALRARIPTVAHVRIPKSVPVAHELHGAGAYVVTNSSATARALREQGDLRVRFVPNGIDADAFAAQGLQGPNRAADRRALRRSIGVPDDAQLALVVANTTPYKALDLLATAVARAMQRAPRLHLVHVGSRVFASSTDFEERYRAIIARSGVADRFHLLGSRADVAALHDIADLVLVPSHGEGTARAILEAWSTTRPVIAADVDGLNDLVVDGRNGRLMDLPDAGASAALIVELLEDAGQRCRLAEGGARDVRFRYSLENHLDALMAVYASLGFNQRPVSVGHGALV